MAVKKKPRARSYGAGQKFDDTPTITHVDRSRQVRLLRQICEAAVKVSTKVLFNGQVWKVVDKGVRYYTLRPVTKSSDEVCIAVRISECLSVFTEEVGKEKLVVSDDGKEIQLASVAFAHESDHFVDPIARITHPSYRFILHPTKGVSIQLCVPTEDRDVDGQL